MLINCLPAVLERVPDALWDLANERIAVFVGYYDSATDTAHITDLAEATNIHEKPADHFALGSAQWKTLKRQAEKRGLAVIGAIHSHCPGHDDGPSPQDVTFARRYPETLIANAVFVSATGDLVWYTVAGEHSRQRLKLPWLYRAATRLSRSSAS